VCWSSGLLCGKIKGRIIRLVYFGADSDRSIVNVLLVFSYTGFPTLRRDRQTRQYRNPFPSVSTEIHKLMHW
jgi:hypothetical protein